MKLEDLRRIAARMQSETVPWDYNELREYMRSLGLDPDQLYQELEMSARYAQAHQDTGDKADQTDNGIEVTACNTQDHTEGAAQEHQRADHDKEAKDETCDGGRAAAGLELLTEDQADDFGTDVLNNTGCMHANAAGDITQEAGDAEAHVCRVAQLDQQDSSCANDQTGGDHQQIFLVFHLGSLQS